jgi:dTDP-4-amino-4,6-dideoxygalactose transaminase
MFETSAVRSTASPIVPCDPRAGVLAHRDEIDAAVRRVLDSGRYILGPEVESFEQEFSRYLSCEHAIGVASGTDAIQLAVRACGIGPGDIVLTVSHTAVATVTAIELTGATPALIDIDKATYTMDPQSLENAIRRCNADGALKGRVKAVLPVHLYGLPADMPSIIEISKRNGLRVIEDCSQAHGAAIAGRKVGTLGDIAAFSLYPTKNLGAIGDAGIVTTNDRALADRIRLLREYGWKQRNQSEIPGLNSRLDELQAAILRARLIHLDCDNMARRKIAEIYHSALGGSVAVLPVCPPDRTHVYHQYVIAVPSRDALRQTLAEQGIGTLIHYQYAVHQQPAYRDRLLSVVNLDNTESVLPTILSLPMYPELNPDAANLVADAIQSFLHMAT